MWFWLRSLFTAKAAPEPPASRHGGYAGGPVDIWGRRREPSSLDLLRELKSTAFACASINASVCASHPPRLYVTTSSRQPKARVPTRPLPPWEVRALAERHTPLAVRLKSGDAVEEVTEHPLLALLDAVNPVLNGFDLLELTQLYLEVIGTAYWTWDEGAFAPEALWVLPAQYVRPVRERNSTQLVDYYEYTGGGTVQRYSPESIIRFAMPDPRNPYLGGLSPLRAAWEQATLSSQYSALKHSVYENKGLPGAILSPEEVIGEEEADRLEVLYKQKLLRGGQGSVLVAREKLSLQTLQWSMGDLAALAEQGATKEDVANAFRVPLPYLSRDTNMANMQASDNLHARFAIFPRLRRRDATLNQSLVPLYDQTGRLFVASDNPVPDDKDHDLKQQGSDLDRGVITINEERARRGLVPVPWGDKPYSIPKVQLIDSDNDPATGASSDSDTPAPAKARKVTRRVIRRSDGLIDRIEEIEE